MNNTQPKTVNEMRPAVGAQVLVRFEDLTIDCTVLDAKNSYGRVRILVAPVNGYGHQWVETSRLVLPPAEGTEVTRRG